MADLALYLGIALLGYIIGSKINISHKILALTGKFQTAAIAVLVLAMGLRMGANQEVIKNIGSIGFYALVMTVFVLIFSVAALYIVRRLMGFDKYGMLGEGEVRDYSSSNNEGSAGINKMTVIIVIAVMCGMVAGYLLLKFYIEDFNSYDHIMGTIIKVGLCVLLLFVGIDLGFDGTVIEHFKKIGIRVVIIPVAVIIGSLAGAFVCGLVLPISIKEALSIGAGLGWYSLAPGIILEKGFVIASAISFIHNVLRELLSLVAIPFVAKKIGYLETVSLPGAAAMDVCLPIVEKATRSEIAVFSFISGVVLSAAVPILVPLMLSL